MMKTIILCLSIFMFGVSASKAQGRAPAGDDWKLTNDQAIGMLDRLNNCDWLHPCNNSTVKDPDNDVYRWIVSRYSGVASITLVDARYRNTDEDRYKRLRGITEERKANVKGYKTKLVKVEFYPAKNLSLSEPIYYDCFTICPPPDICN